METLTTLDGRRLVVPLSREHLDLLDMLARHEGDRTPSMDDMAEAFGMTKSGLRYRLERLRLNAMVEWPARRHRAYRLTALGRWALESVEAR